jgi:2-polyprenyl-3-methyl-5-hydroxy-6-metoxy-1,4-benzoquinol methylase
MSTYAIRGGTEGARRLDLLARTMAPTTEALLASVGVRSGARCLDLGCGAGHVSRLMGAQVGPDGRVVGLDFDAVKLEAARRDCATAGFGNIEFRATDVTAWRERETYDLIYGRFILSHLADRRAMLRAGCEALRSGGLLVLEDIDFSGCFCWPPNDGYASYCRLYHAVIGRKGGDANVGAQLFALCLEAGLADVRVQVVQPTHTGHCAEKGLSLSTLVNIADAVLAEGLATREELDTAIASLTDLTEDPGSVVGLPRIFQVWGRKPAGH